MLQACNPEVVSSNPGYVRRGIRRASSRPAVTPEERSSWKKLLFFTLAVLEAMHRRCLARQNVKRPKAVLWHSVCIEDDYRLLPTEFWLITCKTERVISIVSARAHSQCSSLNESGFRLFCCASVNRSHLWLVLLVLIHTLHLQQVLGHAHTGKPRLQSQMTRQAELCEGSDRDGQLRCFYWNQLLSLWRPKGFSSLASTLNSGHLYCPQLQLLLTVCYQNRTALNLSDWLNNRNVGGKYSGSPAKMEFKAREITDSRMTAGMCCRS